jgi:hypothetical protein
MTMQRPDRITVMLVAALAVAVGYLSTCGGCGTTSPASRYVTVSETWTALLEVTMDAHEAGLIDQGVMQDLVPIVEQADEALEVIRENLPAEGATPTQEAQARLEMAYEILRAAIGRLVEVQPEEASSDQ